MTMYLVYLFIILLMFSGVVRGKIKRFDPIKIWILPILFLWMLVDAIPRSALSSPTALIAITLALTIGGGIGLGLGLLRGKSMHFDVDAAGVFYQNSYISVIFFTAVILFKWGVSAFFIGSPFASLLSLALVAVSCGSIIGRRIFITFKAVELAR